MFDQQASSLTGQAEGQVLSEYDKKLPNSEFFTNMLSSHVRKAYEAAYDAKRDVDAENMKSLRQRKGEYEPELRAQIEKEKSNPIYIMLTDIKCRALAAWLKDIFADAQEYPFGVDPTPVPETDPAVKQRMRVEFLDMMQNQEVNPEMAPQMLEDAEQALKTEMGKALKDSAMKMETKIQDQLEEGNFRKAIIEFIEDFVTYKAAFLKGPITRKKKKLTWGPEGQPVVSETLVEEFERISPFDVFPAPHSVDVDDGDLCIVHRMSPRDIKAMQGIPGSKDEVIGDILAEYGMKGSINWISRADQFERDQLEKSTNIITTYTNKIDVVEFRGSVQGSMLIDWGVSSSQIDDPNNYYDVEAWLFNRQVFRCTLSADPLGKKPIYKSCAYKIPGSFWGTSLPERMRDQQEMVNVSGRSMADNIALASGPMVMYDADAAPSSEYGVPVIQPWGVYAYNGMSVPPGRKPFEFYQTTLNSAQLIQVYDKFSEAADEVTGIPKYQYTGESRGGAGNTASGLSMLMENSNKNIKSMIINIDIEVIQPLIQRTFEYNMLYNPDPSIKGDIQIKARGASAALQRETIRMRRLEFTAQTNNPTDMQIIDLEGRAELLRENARGMDMNVDEIVPTKQQMEAKLAQQQLAMEQAQAQQMQQQGVAG